MDEVVPPLKEERIYVAVGKNVEKNMSSVIWASQNGEDSNICIIHVHQPPQMVPVMGTKFRASSVDDKIVEEYRGKERKRTEEMLDQYLHICSKNGITAEKLYIEMDSIEKGIVQLITQHGITKLVMGAAADKHHSVRMTDLRSKKAIFVRQHAPATCHIWFTCKGNLINTREAVKHEIKTISKLLSEFQELVLREKHIDRRIQDVQSGRVWDWSVDTDEGDRECRTSSFRFTGMLSSNGGSDEDPSEKSGEPESSSGNRSFPKEREEAKSSRRGSFCCICFR